MKRKLLKICALLSAMSLGVGAAAEPVDLLEVDHRLYELGYRDGAYSGAMDEVMVNALRNFQQANGLGVTGEADAGTVLVLSSEAAVSQQDYLTRIAQDSAGAQVLSDGQYGADVKQLQVALQELGYFNGDADGAYGEGTAAAVRRFQLANGLEETGVADGALTMRLYAESPVDWESFLRGSTAEAGDAGAKVHALQYWLRRKGYYEGESTGRYGEDTQRAVRQFQRDVGLEASGNADYETCRALFEDVDALLADAAALRRGDAGAAPLCGALRALGYPAGDGDTIGLQTELALMQFQHANDLPITGVADVQTMDRFLDPDVMDAEGYAASGEELATEEGFTTRIVREASHLVGTLSDFEDSFGLVQYVYLKCGVAVESRAQFTLLGIDVSQGAAGDVMVLGIDGAELFGVVTSDGGLIYRAGDGRILMGYPETMDAESIRLYRMAAQ